MRPLSVAVVLALAVPALAQPPGRFNPQRPEAELDKLRAQVKEVEAKLKGTKDDDKKGEEKEEKGKKDGDKKPDVKKEERRIEIRIEEPKKGDGDKKPEPRKGEGDKKPDAPRGPMGGFGGSGFGPMGPGGFNPPMGAEFPRGGGFNPSMGGGSGGPGTPPGFDKLSKDEQQMFRRLMEKMQQPERKPDQPKSGGNLEQRMERLERMIEEIRNQMNRGHGGPGGGQRGPGGEGGPMGGGGRGPGR